MILIAIFIISLLALLVDWYIYRRIVRRNLLGKAWRKGYIIYAIAVDLVVIGALVLHKSSLISSDNHLIHVVMWIICIFFLNAVPKFVYVIISLGDYIIRLFLHKRSHLFGYIGTVAGVVVLGAMIWSTTRGRSEIEVRRVSVHSSKLPAGFDGFRIVQFSDTHVGTLINPQQTLERMVDTINSLNADMVVASGDLVNTDAGELTEDVIGVLSQIRSRHGVYSVLGNHDLGFYISDSSRYTPRTSVERILEVKRHMGWHSLVNRSQRVGMGADTIVISGVNFPVDFRHNGHTSEMAGVDLEQTFTDTPDSLYNIVISHAPQLWANLKEIGRGDLTLAGHVHSMQVKLRVGKWLWSPAKFMYDWWSGLYTDGERSLYVNDGIGYVMYPMRVGTRPEVTLIELFVQ